MFIDTHTPALPFSPSTEPGPSAQSRARDTEGFNQRPADDQNHPSSQPLPPKSRITLLDDERGSPRESELANRKLRQNPLVLSQQIEELGEMLRQMRAEMKTMHAQQAMR